MSSPATYQHQDSAQTLEEGIAEYYAKHPSLVKGRGISEEAREFFRCHDAAHVLFGCRDSLADEAAVKISSIFGTTGGFGVLRGYRLRESQDIYRTLGLGEQVATALLSVILVPRTILRCLRMRRRWPWRDHARYLNVPLRDLRREFGVRVAQSSRRA